MVLGFGMRIRVSCYGQVVGFGMAVGLGFLLKVWFLVLRFCIRVRVYSGSFSVKELGLVVSIGRVTGFGFSVSGIVLGLVSILAFGSSQRE